MVAIRQMAILVMIMMIGFIAAKNKVFGDNASTNFSKLLTFITSPALILSAVNSAGELGTKNQAILFLIYAFLLYGSLILISLVVHRVIKVPLESRGALRFLTVFSNNGFMGFPVILALYGPGALFYASLINIPNNLYVYSYGVWTMSENKGKTKLDWREILLSPGFLASVIAFIFFLFDLKLPDIVQETVSTVGAITTPLAMMIIGMSIANISIKSAIKTITIYKIAFFRMLLFPAIVYLIFSQFISNPIILSVLVVISGMPGPSVATSYATLFGGDIKLSTSYVFVSTILSVLTIPIVTHVLTLLL